MQGLTWPFVELTSHFVQMGLRVQHRQVGALRKVLSQQAIAAEKTGRRARAIELDPKYVDVAIRRWEQYTGKTARLAPMGETFDERAEARLGNVAA